MARLEAMLDSASDIITVLPRNLYRVKTNAAGIAAAKAAGATEIVVVDCHGAGKDWNFNSLVPEDLRADAERFLALYDAVFAIISWASFEYVVTE